MWGRKAAAGVMALACLTACTGSPTQGQPQGGSAPQTSTTRTTPSTLPTRTTRTTPTPKPPTSRPPQESLTGRASEEGSTQAPHTGTPSSMPPYVRAEFTLDGKRWDWTDLDRIPGLDRPGDQCDGRQEAVRRATTNRHYTSSCYIATADVHDVYTGVVYPDVRTSAYQVDHVVSLADAWRSGAWRWTRAKRTRFANSPEVTTLTVARLNEQKSDQGPDTWSAPSPTGDCWFVRQYRLIKHLWGLQMTRAQRAAVRARLASC